MNHFPILTVFAFAMVTVIGAASIGHFPSSTNLLELFHMTDSPQQFNQKGGFTYKWTLPPFNKKTFAPLNLNVASKERHPHGTTKPPSAVEILNRKLPTFPPGAFTFKWTLPPFNKKNFDSLNFNAASKKPQTHGTTRPSVVSQKELYHHGGVTYTPIHWMTVKPVKLTTEKNSYITNGS